jgi:hypothetical protein
MLSNEDMKFGLAILLCGMAIGAGLFCLFYGLTDGFGFLLGAIIAGLLLTSTLYENENENG